MNLLMSVIACLLVFTCKTNAGEIVDLSFNAKYSLGIFHSQPSVLLPIDTTLTISFEILPTNLTTNAGLTRRDLNSMYSIVNADSPIFSDLPEPHINWSDEPLNNGFVSIERNDATSMYRLVAARSNSYVQNCFIQCTYFFKGISVISDYISATNYDPFANPIQFIKELQTFNTPFESNLTQHSWQRFTRGDRYIGASLNTSIYSIGLGSRFQGGGAWLTNVASQVPELDTYAMFLAGLGVLGFTARRKRAKSSPIIYKPTY